jgi:tol-pal system protein YbgF
MFSKWIADTKPAVHRVALFSVLIACVGLFACGGGARNQAQTPTADEGEVDIDKLLGTPEQEKKQSAEEQEVLRLLGIAPDESASDTAKVAPTAQALPQSDMNIEGEVERLQRELQQRDQQIADLRSELAMQEKRAQELQSRQVRKVTPAPIVQVRGVSSEYRAAYERAMSHYNRHNYREALAGFSSLLAMDDKNSLADNAQYWIGECYYGMGNYNQAVAEFQKVFSFTRSNKSDAALLKLGLCYIRLGDRNQARSELEQLIANFPRSEYVSKARNFLAAANGR